MPLPAIRHVTLTPDAVETVTVVGDYEWVGVLHTGNVEEPLWVAVRDGVTPAADADDVYLVPTGAQRIIERAGAVAPSTVRLVSAGAAAVEVEFT